MRTKAFIALALLAAICGLLVAVRAQLRDARRPAPATAAADEVTAIAPDWAPRLRLPAEDRVDEEWPYETLSAEERAVVDRGRDTTGWEGVHQAFSAAPRE